MSFPICATAQGRLGWALCRGLTAHLTFLEWDERENITPKLVQISSRDFPLQWRERVSAQSMIWLVLSSFCWRRLVSELAGGEAAHPASNVVALTDPQKKKSFTLCLEAEPSFQQGCCSWKTRSQLEQDLDLDPSPASSQAGLQQCWRRAGFRAGAGVYSSGLTASLPVSKALDGFILPLCESQPHRVGGSAQAHCAQPDDAPAALWARKSHLSAGAGVQMCVFGQLTHTWMPFTLINSSTVTSGTVTLEDFVRQRVK